ncbi:UDP-Glycosyltransferase superfamily protein [Perilla frutescens var. frutescens]|nr:UDP-Glycosyltransferase superfamily protein [Perilla frutescens var. frutescens]
MGRNSLSAGDSASDDASAATFHSIRDRFPFKRNTNTNSISELPRSSKTTTSAHKTSRSHHHHKRKLSLYPFKGKSRFYLCIFAVIFTFSLASVVLQSSIMLVFRQGVGSDRMRWRWSVKEGLELGSSLEFVPRRQLEFNGIRLDSLRSQPRMGVRPPKIALILGNMKKDPSALLLYSLMKNLKGLGYLLKLYALKDGRAQSVWQELGGPVSIIWPERYGYVDWSIFEGIVADSLEAKHAISSLMQEPFCSVPLIWIIQEDALANRLQLYEDMGWGNLISNWKSAFSRADLVVFPEFSFPMLYSVLDTGNFFVIPGSPIDVWAAESYIETHSKSQLRKENGFDDVDLLVLVLGSSFFYYDLAWDYAMAMHDLEPVLLKYAGQNDVGFTSKFIFVCGNSSKEYSDALQDIATRLGLKQGSLKHYGINSDVNSLILMADIVLYGSSQEEQGFPPLLTRAMSFGIPIIAPDYPVISKYVVDGVHGIIFPKTHPKALRNAFSLMVSDRKLSRFAHSVASSGSLHAKNMFAEECIFGLAKLVEDVFHFPSDVLLPTPASQLQNITWEWSLFRKELDQISSERGHLYLEDHLRVNSSVVYDLEEEMINYVAIANISRDNPEGLEEDTPTVLDWEILSEMESSEEVELLEREEIEERMEKDIGEWDDIYRNARKSEKLRFETNLRDEGELERTGQPICIYEIYNGAGGWPFLHHGSLYRGLSLSTRARRLSSDDVDAVGRLPILNDTHYRNILCEIGGMFAIANGIDEIHKGPWIGFQSWRAAGKRVSLSKQAEEVLEKTIQGNTEGDVIYFWAHLDMDGGVLGESDMLTFWSTCDIMNAGRCRTAFGESFRRMYGLPSNVEALPPMPQGDGHWLALHSWAMPTSSFLEFVMFSRMFIDSLHGLHMDSTNTSACFLGLSAPEKKHCYCRIAELLVNVWAYHSARKIVYIDPHSGLLKERHPIDQRKGFMWAKYFNGTLLKSMDEDLAEAADDDDHPYRPWLWPLTGEVFWQGVYEREREERYRLKMDKKRKIKEKLLDRLKHGYKQKTLGG